jgi:DNA-binding response OmpR family regulator
MSLSVMIVGVKEGDTEHPFFGRFQWTIHRVTSCLGFLMHVFRLRPDVVICGEELPDGTWKDILGVVATLYSPPPVIVITKLADDNLWAEVLTLGGYDALAEPLDPDEVRRVVEMAGVLSGRLRRTADDPLSPDDAMAT